MMANFSFEHHTRSGVIHNRIQEECKLYVKYLPQELTEDDVYKIFSNFGQITGVFTFKNLDWAFISFLTRQEAENAIKELHNKAPLNLHISFAKGNNTNNSEVGNSHNQDGNTNHYNFNHGESSVQSICHNKAMGKPSTSHALGNAYTFNGCDDTTRSNISLYEQNDLWTRGVLNNVGNQRHVELGSSHPLYSIPNLQPQIEAQITKVFQKRSTEPSEANRDQGRLRMGPCQYCAIMTSMMCRCCTFYCSVQCQITDWASHKLQCQPIPALVKLSDSVPLSQSNGEEHVAGLNFPNKLVSHNSNDSLYKPPMKFVDTPLKNAKNNENKNELEKDVFQDEVVPTHCQSHDNKKPIKRDQEKKQFNFTPSRNCDVNKEQTQFDKDQNSDKKWKNSDKKTKEKSNKGGRYNNQYNPDDDFFSKTQFKIVKIVKDEHDAYWVQKVEDQNAIKNFQRRVSISAQKGRIVEPILNHVYGMEYEGFWYRVRITSLDPLRGRYVDYGYHEWMKNGECHLIHDIRDLPRYARKIRLSNDSIQKHKNLQPDDILSVRMISLNSDYIEVEVQEKGPNETVTPNFKDIQFNSYDHETMRKYFEPDRNSNQKFPIVNTSSINCDNEFEDNAETLKKPQGMKYSEKALEVEQSIKSFEKDFLSKSQFTKVDVVVSEKNEHWVHKEKSKQAMAKMMCDLQDAACMVQPVQPELGNMYAVLYEEIWHRAIVKSLNPLTVHYVDFGNDEIIETPDFRPIKNFVNIPQFVKKIRIVQNSNHERKDIGPGCALYVKMISVDDDNIINVEIRDDDEKSSQQTPGNLGENQSTPKELPSVIDFLSIGVSGVIEIQSIISPHNYSVTLTPQHLVNELERIWLDLNGYCKNLEIPKDYTPYVGELVCGLNEDNNWVRGHITTLNYPIKIALLDDVKETIVSKVLPYPKEFLNICAFGLICATVDSELQMEVGETWAFKVTGPNRIEITYHDDSLNAIVRCPRRN